MLNIVDDVTRECLAAIPDTSICGRRVARVLTELIAHRGKPGMIVSDHGTEFTSNAILAWSKDYRIEWHYIAPGKPMQNGYVEFQRPDARRAVEREPVLRPRPRSQHHRRMEEDFNTARPHSSLGYQTPAAYAEVITATGSDAAPIEGSAPPPVALPAPNSVTEMVAAVIATG